MNDEVTNNSKKAVKFLATVGDVASIVILPLGIWGWFTIQQSIALNRIQSESAAKDVYVTKSEYQTTVANMTGNDARLDTRETMLQDSINNRLSQIDIKLQELSDKMPETK